MRNALLIAFALTCFSLPAHAGVVFVSAGGADHYQDSTVLFDATDYPFTVAVWWFNQAGATGWLMGTGTGTTREFTVGRGSMLTNGSTSSETLIVSSGRVDDEWNLIVCVWTSATSRALFINDGSTTDTGTTNLGSVQCTETVVGTRSRRDSFLTGTIGSITVWKGVSFTVADVANLWARIDPGQYRAYLIKNHFPCRGDGPAAARLRDMVGGAHIDTASGTPAKGDNIPFHSSHQFYGLRSTDPLRLLPTLHRFERCRENEYA